MEMFHKATRPGFKDFAANTLKFKTSFNPLFTKIVKGTPSLVGVC